MKANFMNTVQVRKPQTSTFDLSHDHKLSCNMGELIPIMVKEVLPGDRWNIRHENLTRFQSLISPVMQRFKIKTYDFFVPNRLSWENWEYWITGDETEVLPPTISVAAANTAFVGPNTLADYMGLVPGKKYDVTDGNDFNALPFAAYQRVWWDWFRDQNLQAPNTNEEFVILPDGVSSASTSQTQVFLQKRTKAWAHDYFTSCLPFAQKGQDVTIPFGEFDDVGLENVAKRTVWLKSDDTNPGVGNTIQTAAGVGFVQTEENGNTIYDTYDESVAKTSELEVPAPTINELRRAFAVQRWLEINARGGTRYVESIKAHFDVRSSDQRLQRAEFIGAETKAIVVSEVLQTSGPNAEDDSGVVGDMAGHAISFSQGNQKSYFAEEHGFIISLVCVMPDSGYFQGVDQMFWRKDRFQYPWPSFAHLGEEAIENRELFYSGETADVAADHAVFGYLPRYGYFRTAVGRVSGDFRNSLDFWQYDRKFETRPALNESFITYSNDNRIFAVQDENTQHVLLHVNNVVYVNRRLPQFGTPI